MLLRDLGTLLVRNGHVELPVGGSKASAILAMLAVNANSRVSTEALMAAVWGDRVSAGAASTLESHVWRPRQLLEPARGRRQAPTVLINDTDGYRLIAMVDTVDSLRFERLAGEVRDLSAAGDPGRALRRADDALALWRGRPFGSYADTPWAAAAVARLTEARDQLLERRIDALLATCQGDRALADLEGLIVAMPYREGLWGQRMTGLYRSGGGLRRRCRPTSGYARCSGTRSGSSPVLRCGLCTGGS